MLQQARMPNVKFVREVEEKRGEDGEIIRIEVDFAEVTPAGGKDTTIKVVKDWLKQLQDQSYARGPFDNNAEQYAIWYEKVSAAYEKWKQGEDLAFDGVPIRTHPAFTKLEKANIEGANVYTLEDLAAANEETLRRIGMQSRELKNRAIKLLENQPNEKNAEIIAAQAERIKALEDQVKELEANQRQKPGPKSKTTELAEAE